MKISDYCSVSTRMFDDCSVSTRMFDDFSVSINNCGNFCYFSCECCSVSIKVSYSLNKKNEKNQLLLNSNKLPFLILFIECKMKEFAFSVYNRTFSS